MPTAQPSRVPPSSSLSILTAKYTPSIVMAPENQENRPPDEDQEISPFVFVVYRARKERRCATCWRHCSQSTKPPPNRFDFYLRIVFLPNQLDEDETSCPFPSLLRFAETRRRPLLLEIGNRRCLPRSPFWPATNKETRVEIPKSKLVFDFFSTATTLPSFISVVVYSRFVSIPDQTKERGNTNILGDSFYERGMPRNKSHDKFPKGIRIPYESTSRFKGKH
ncbi:unnamed protein product [Lactuca saligna]|uniref:Uncharacterized protein n=1 Tax=Lactuca saligna TaxID=75948 RepID=A0AA35YPC8_LACSI|nr:unnamed protein product [Lactuca saligna]